MEKKPALIWRLKDAPLASFKDDMFWEDEEGYREWRAGKTGDEFVIMIPESWAFYDFDAAHELGLNVTEDMRSHDFSGKPNPDCEVFSHCHYERSTYEVYIVPALTGRDAGVKTTAARDDLDELGLADRTLKALRGAQIETVEQLSKMTVLQLLRIKDCGKKCLNDVERALARRGLAIIDDVPRER